MTLKKYLLLITLFTFNLNISTIPCWANNPYDDEELGTSSSTHRLILDDEENTSYGSIAHHQVYNREKECNDCWGACCGVLIVGVTVVFVIYLLTHLKFSH